MKTMDFQSPTQKTFIIFGFKMKTKPESYIFSISTIFIGFVIFSSLFYFKIGTDFGLHFKMAKLYFENKTLPANFLFYLLLMLFSGFSSSYKLLVISCVIILTTSILLKFKTSLKTIQFLSPNSNPRHLCILAILLLFVHPLIYSFSFNNNLYF